jgi:hypothetical protein
MSKEEEKTKLVVHDSSEFAVYLDTARFEHSYRVAKAFSASDLIPKHYQGQVSNCLIATNLAFRVGMDPIMFMQKAPIINGKMTLEGQAVIALVNSMKPFKTGINFDYSGTPENPTCTAWAITKDGERIEYSLSKQEALKIGNASKNPNWQNATKLMLSYRAATYLIRLYAPEVLMGLSLNDEVQSQSVVDVTPSSSLDDLVIDSEEEAQEIEEESQNEEESDEPAPADEEMRLRKESQKVREREGLDSLV